MGERILYAVFADNHKARFTARTRQAMKIRARIQYRVDDNVDIELSNADVRKVVSALSVMKPEELRALMTPREWADMAGAALSAVECAIDTAPLTRDEDYIHFRDTVARIADKIAEKSERFGQSKGKRA